MNRDWNHVAAPPIARASAVWTRWRAGAVRSRTREVRADRCRHVRCHLGLGFALPPLDTTETYQRLKFLHDCIKRFARSGASGSTPCTKLTRGGRSAGVPL